MPRVRSKRKNTPVAATLNGTEQLEHRLAMSANPIDDLGAASQTYESPEVSRVELKPATTLSLSPNEWGPQYIGISRTQLKDSIQAGAEDMSFIVSHVAKGVVEKLNPQTGKWVDISPRPPSSNPALLLEFLRLREIKPTDQIRWNPGDASRDTSARIMDIIGWDGTSASKAGRVDATVPTTSEEVTVHTEYAAAAIAISETGDVLVEIPATYQFEWMSESNKIGISHPEYLISTFEQLQGTGLRAGIALANDPETTDDDDEFVIELTEPPQVTDDGFFRLRGSLVSQQTVQAQAFRELVGEEFATEHETFLTNMATAGWLDARQYSVPQAAFDSSELSVTDPDRMDVYNIVPGQIDILLDTYTVQEYETLPEPFDVSFSATYSSPDTGSSSSNSVLANFDTFAPSNFSTGPQRIAFVDKTIEVGPGSIQLDVGITTDITISADLPEGLWQKLNFQSWVVDFNASATWDASATVTTGIDENSRWTGEYSVPLGDPISLPTDGAVPGTELVLSPGLDFNWTLAAPQIAETYTWSADQTFTFQKVMGQADASWCEQTKDLNPGTTVTTGPVNHSFPTFNLPTSLAANFVLTPSMEISWGIGRWGISVAKVGASVKYPISADLFVNWKRSDEVLTQTSGNRGGIGGRPDGTGMRLEAGARNSNIQPNFGALWMTMADTRFNGLYLNGGGEVGFFFRAFEIKPAGQLKKVINEVAEFGQRTWNKFRGLWSARVQKNENFELVGDAIASTKDINFDGFTWQPIDPLPFGEWNTNRLL